MAEYQYTAVLESIEGYTAKCYFESLKDAVKAIRYLKSHYARLFYGDDLVWCTLDGESLLYNLELLKGRC